MRPPRDAAYLLVIVALIGGLAGAGTRPPPTPFPADPECGDPPGPPEGNPDGVTLSDVTFSCEDSGGGSLTGTLKFVLSSNNSSAVIATVIYTGSWSGWTDQYLHSFETKVVTIVQTWRGPCDVGARLGETRPG